MGCSCNKRRKPRPTTQTPPNDSQTSGSGSGTATRSFELVTDSGQVLSFGSRLEADAANRRRGGAGRVRPV